MSYYHAIAIDGSLQNMGIAVVVVSEHTNAITEVLSLKLNKTKATENKKLRKSYDDLDRFRSHWDFLNENIKKFDCKIAFAEIPSGAQDARAAFAFGGITSMMACLPVPLYPVYPLEVKAATGTKHADKEDIINWAYQKWPYADWITSKRPNALNITTTKGLYLTNANEHLADALAVAEAGLKYL